MSSFQDVARRWAARRLGVGIEEVIAVAFDCNDGRALSEYTWEPGEIEARVTMRAGPDRYIEDAHHRFEDWLEELVAIAGGSERDAS